MPKIPESVTKESYLLKSTFFYNRLRSEGYFELFVQIKKYAKVEGAKLIWSNKELFHISNEAWEIVKRNDINPMLVFVHPKVLQLNPHFLKYYRSIAMIPQKGLKAISGVSNVDGIEDGKVISGGLSHGQIERLVQTINETMSTVVSLALDINEKKLEGMMYATAGTKIDGSWRNSIGAEGERVIRRIILFDLLSHSEVTSVVDKDNRIHSVSEWDIGDDLDCIKIINLVNGYSILFSSEPDVTMYDYNGAIVGVIEIKSGLDPAGALERLGAMFKSFENTLAEYPNAVTILVASCITDEVESRLGASMLVRQRYITTNITSSEHEKRKFVNKIRAIVKLIKSK
ncbi:MAG: XcyI family restriction endonuclease [Bacteroidales bacterium]|nr:XcyI family restriction endonuclease [Bacteroidales bacterium]